MVVPSGEDAIRIEVSILAARWCEAPLVQGYIDLFNPSLRGRARFEFRAGLETRENDTTYTFTRLCRPNSEGDFSALGPAQDKAHVFFAAAVHAAVGAVRQRALESQVQGVRGDGERLTDRPRERPDVGITVRFSFDADATGLGHVMASLIGPGSWFGTQPVPEA